jgi:nucleotide-binding universal stress UspA family protein
MKALINNIGVAISGSDSSINAAKYAIMLAKNYKLELYVIYVVDTQTIRELMLTKIFIEEESREFEKNLYANGDRYLAFVEELAKSKGVKIHKILKTGSIASMILEAADEENLDMLLLGGWEINRSKRDLISKSHMEILMDAKIPVMVVKEEEIEQMFKKYS